MPSGRLRHVPLCVCLPNIILAGDMPASCLGVFLSSSNANCTSPPHAIVMRNVFFASFIPGSAFPLDRGYIGDDVACSNFQSCANRFNYLDENCGALSLTSCNGIPYRPKCPFRLSITWQAVVEDNLSTSMKPEK